jgi:hypothetical protein
MVTNRRPLSRPRQPPFPPEALRAFRAMVELEKTSDYWPPSECFDQWADLHWVLHRALNLKPWQWWAVEPPYAAEGQDQGEDARARWLALSEAAGISLE